MSNLQKQYETLKGEGLKTSAELCLQVAGSSNIGQKVLEHYAFGPEGRIMEESLRTNVAGVEFENPVLFGAGWDKKGRAIHGLYHLGFAGGEIGTVLLHPQRGNPKPRLWTINPEHSVGLNRLGFNSPGMERVREYLEAALPLPCPIGINVGRNKLSTNDRSIDEHAQTIKYLGKFAQYIALGISSPNTKDLRGLQDKEPFRNLIRAAQIAKSEAGLEIPLFAKIDSERTPFELYDMIEVATGEGLDGFIATNTYMGADLKAKYGLRWEREQGGLSGADPAFRKKATETVKFIHKEAGDTLDVIGVGGVDSADTALEKIRAGASAVQVVTGIRPSYGKVAAKINQDLAVYLEKEGIASIQELIGSDLR